VRIETGASEDHPTPLPYDPSQSPGVNPPTLTVGQLRGPTVDVSVAMRKWLWRTFRDG
jgi:hypothetical protein